MNDESWDGVTPRDKLIALIKQRWTIRLEAVTTSSGEHTTTYLDIPHVLGDNQALHLAGQVLINHLDHHGLLSADGVTPLITAVGGPLTGSIPLVLAVNQALPWVDDLKWFALRDKPKTHGLGRIFVGAQPGPDDKVILTDDVASTGRSLMQAGIQVAQTGAQVAAITPLVDRGDQAGELFARDGIPYLPVLTYHDLNLNPLA